VQETADAKPADKPRPVAKPAIAQAPPGWRVQLGAFGKRAQAEAAWAELRAKQKAAIGSAKPIYEPGASIIKLQMGPYKTRAEARDACAKIAFGGRACFATEAAKP
jgi:cell division septation protein DedD